MEPSWRKPAGVIALIVYLAAYAGAVSQLAPVFNDWPTPLLALAYLALGVAWLPPVKPLLRWMAGAR